VARHQDDVSARNSQALSDRRNGAPTICEVRERVSELGEFLQEKRLPPLAILNYDVCRLVTQFKRFAVKRVHAADRERANVASIRGATVASLLSSVAGDGAPFFGAYILRARLAGDDAGAAAFVLSGSQSRTRSSWPRFYGWTETGFPDAAGFAAVMDLCCHEWEVRNPGRERLLLGDQLRAHWHMKVVRSAL